jgi:hypothetical protein
MRMLQLCIVLHIELLELPTNRTLVKLYIYCVHLFVDVTVYSILYGDPMTSRDGRRH